MDPILYWNEVALEANRQDFSVAKPLMPEQDGPTLSSRALAIVHLAMYDAYAGAKGFPPNLPKYNPALAPGVATSPNAAVAAAAHTTLSALYPRQRGFFDSKLGAAGLVGADVARGIAYGQDVATRLLSRRAGDPRAGDAGYIPSLGRFRHRPDPDNEQGFHAPFYGSLAMPFAVTSLHTILDPMTALPPAAYTAALNEVRGLGIAPEQMGTLPAALTKRTPEQALVGIYWGYDGANLLGTPPRLFNQIVRIVAEARGNDTDANARLFALVNAAMGDAGILAWREKYRHNLWRPVIGIREHDDSMGPSASSNPPFSPDCDPGWLPLGAPKTNAFGQKNFTPPFPAYPSGHATFGAAALHATRLFYRAQPGGNTVVPSETGPDKLFQDLSFVSDECNGVNKDNKGTTRPIHARKFPGGLWTMIEENGRSRVYLGVHWVFDAFAVAADGSMDLGQNIGGVPLGLAIAEDIFNDGLKLSTVAPTPP